MKKILLLLAFVATLSFVSCTKEAPDFLRSSKWSSEFKEVEEGVSLKVKVILYFGGPAAVSVTTEEYEAGKLTDTYSEVQGYSYPINPETKLPFGTGKISIEPGDSLSYVVAGTKLTLNGMSDNGVEVYPQDLVFKQIYK